MKTQPNPVYFSDPTGLAGQGGCSWCNPVADTFDREIMDAGSASQPQIGSLFDIYTGGSFNRPQQTHISGYVNPNSEYVFLARSGNAKALSDYVRRYGVNIYNSNCDQYLTIIDYYTNGDLNRYIDSEIIIKGRSNLNLRQLTQGGPPPTADLILRFNQSVNELFLTRMASAFSGSVDTRALEQYVQYYGNSPFRDDVNAVPTRYSPDGFKHPWSFAQSIYLAGYSITGLNSDGSTAFSIRNPFFNEGRRENLEYEMAGFGAPYWSTSFSSGSKTIKVFVIYNTHDPSN